jgi:murein DD-endopeptidase MepM/ murein hydrolase activator NlpD
MTTPELRVSGEHVAGVYVPLADVQPADPTMGGYTWLDWTDNGQTPHPGVDLNSRGGGDADLGAPVYAATDGVVEAVRQWWPGGATGYGTYVVLRTESPWSPQVWLQHCHLQGALVEAGERVQAGDQLGTCGHSGNQPFAHLHWEVCHARKPTWDTWPYQWSVAQIEQYWTRPADWFWATVATAMAAGETGGVDVSILSGAQQAAIATALFAPRPFNPDTAIGGGWLAEWRAGRYRGTPTADEQDVPEDGAAGKPKGRFQPFTLGCATWLPGEATASWDG